LIHPYFIADLEGVMSTTRTLEVPGHQVVQFLGSGARSTIWQVRNCRSGEILALKRVVKRSADDGRYVEQAVNEWQVGRLLDHAAVRRVYQLRRIKRWLAVVEVHLFLEMCHGRTLQDRRPEAVDRSARVFLQVARGLSHINSRGFVHADIKPNNIMVSEAGVVKVFDLGQSCRIGTVKERIQGTPDFIAPEQVRRLPLDPRTDVFNFGASLYWALTGQPIPTVLPKKNAGLLKANLAVTPPQQLNPQVPPALSKLVLDCVHLQPAHRPQSMDEVASRLGLIVHTLDRAAGVS
jgi:serine/threonine-protein kinase